MFGDDGDEDDDDDLFGGGSGDIGEVSGAGSGKGVFDSEDEDDDDDLFGTVDEPAIIVGDASAEPTTIVASADDDKEEDSLWDDAVDLL